MKNRTPLLIVFITLVIVCLAIMTGCGPRVTPTPEPPTVTPTPENTPTPTPAPERIVLYDPNAQAGDTLTIILSDFAAANSIGFETWTAMGADLAGVKILAVYGAVENLAELAAANPGTQFLALSQTVTPAGNLSSLAVNPLHLAFMAGYLAAMTSEDWRAGALVTDDANLGLADAFFNGGEYLCGACTPKYSPMLYFPQIYTVPGGSDAAAWAAQAQALWTDTNANAVYIDSAGDYPEVLDLFNDEVIYGNNPASANSARYTAILGADVSSSLQAALPELLAGRGGQTFNTKVTLVVVNNTEVITAAKLELFNKVADDLANNLIIPSTVQ